MGTRETGVLIIGASQAGVQLASSLRDEGYDDGILLIGDEIHPPYQRPPLSKNFLDGTVGVEELVFRSPDFYESQRIDLALGQRVERIERNADASGVATTTNGDRIRFTHLALAVGAGPRRLPVDGAQLRNVLYLRDADDARALKDALQASENVVVIGGGFIGLEAAASAKKQGKSVTVLEAAPRLIGRAVGEATSEFFLQAHRRRGIRIELGIGIRRLLGDASGAVAGVELADGTVVPAEVVVIGIGVVPNTELAAQFGLAVENGIAVDEFSRASDGRTVVAGDVANLPNPFGLAEPGSRIRLESVNNAVEQAKNAAATLVGKRTPYSLVPWFWSNQGDLRLQMAGLSGGADDTVIRGDQEAEKFSVLYFRAGRLLAADCINSPLDFIAVRNALGSGKTVPIEAADDTSSPLKALMVAAETAEQPVP